MTPLLAQHGIELDWAFISDLENSNDWNSLKNENLLPIVGQHLAAHGVILVGIEEGTDRYLFAVCTQRFAEIASLSHEHRAVCRLATQRRSPSWRGHQDSHRRGSS